METLLSSFVTIALVGLAGGFITVAIYLEYSKREKAKSVWQAVAKANDLKLVDGVLGSGGAYVRGAYRGCELKLESSSNSKGKTRAHFTRITLWTSPLKHQIQAKNISDADKMAAIRRFTTPDSRYFLQGEMLANSGGEQIFYEQPGLETNPQYLQLLCPTCLARFGPHQVRLAWLNSFIYYGCRSCRQSQKFLDVEHGAIARLDTGMTEPYRYQNQKLWVNWFGEYTLFDFDGVEIINASDEAVERFAVQVGNDTDEFRQPRYQHMPCHISAACKLSENTLRILQRTFGQVLAQ